MSRIIFYFLSLILTTMCFVSAEANAQSLKGVNEVHCYRGSAQPPPLLQGSSDKERWRKLQEIEPKLIGMKYEQCITALGRGKTDDEKSFLSFDMTERKEKHKAGDLSAIRLTVNFKKGIAESYSVVGIRWGN